MLIAVVNQSASGSETLAWMSWLAVIGNVLSILGGFVVLGVYIRKWVLRAAEDVVTPVRHTAKRAETLAKDNKTSIRQVHNRIDALWMRIGD